MITVHATMTPSNPAQRIRSIKHQLMDRRQVMQQAKNYMVNRWNTNFAGNGAIYGPWAGNSTWKEGSGTMHGNTGALAGYFYGANSAGRVSSDSVSWRFENSGDQFSVTHSTSGISPNPLKGHKSIPQRILWNMNGTDQQKITSMVETWIAGKVTF